MPKSQTPTIPIDADEVPDASGWLFIPGVWRSGTTALCQLLSAHRDALVLNEAGLWGYVGILRTPVLWPFGESMFQFRIEHYRVLEQLGQTAWRASQVREMMEGIRRAIAPDTTLFGDKFHYGMVAENLAKVFPNCKCVICRRDEWDVAASLFDVPWFRELVGKVSRPELARIALQRARDSIAEVEPIREKFHVHEVRFEDMASDTVGTTAALLEYLGLDPTRMAWNILPKMRHKAAVGHWKRVPEIAKLREAAECAASQ